MAHLIQLTGIEKSYSTTSAEINVLRGLELKVNSGEFVAIMGASGSGKSTLLHILGCLDRPSFGQYLFSGRKMDEMDDDQLSVVRATEIGFVFQRFHLLPYLSVVENVALPFLYQATNDEDQLQRVNAALRVVGLSHRATHPPSALSGGEMQRVAIARALITHPKLILADEPTGSLDSLSSNGILDILRQLHRTGSTIVLVTHDAKVAGFADRRLTMKDGCFVD